MADQTPVVITPASAVNGGGAVNGKFTSYNGVAAAASSMGVPWIVGYGRSLAQAAAVASVATFTVGASDGSFEISANVNVTTATTHNFSVQCTYTDETNTARTQAFMFAQPAGNTSTSIANATGAVPYCGYPMHIRCKAATVITILTQAGGTYTTVVFNIEGLIKQTA